MAAWTSHGNDFATRTEPLFRNNLEGYPFYRIPSLLAINASLLLAFAEARGQRTDHGHVSLVMKRSMDGGATWSPLSVVQAAAEGRKGTIGNPAPLYDASEGSVVLFYCRENREIYSTRSSDFGDSWSAPQTIAWSRPADWQWVATGPPAALVTTRGQWVLPCDGLTGSFQLWKADRVFSFALTSADKGFTWRQGPLLDGGNECQAAELQNGSLVLNMRSKEMVRLHSTSNDGGTTWSEPKRAPRPKGGVPDGNCQGSMISLTHDCPGGASCGMLLATSVGHGRKVLTARTSRDGGDSWDHYAKLEAGPAGYSALAELSDGWAAVLYEAKWLLKPPPESKRSNPKPVEEDVIVFARVRVGTEAPQIITRPAMKMKRDEL